MHNTDVAVNSKADLSSAVWYWWSQEGLDISCPGRKVSYMGESSLGYRQCNCTARSRAVLLTHCLSAYDSCNEGKSHREDKPHAADGDHLNGWMSEHGRRELSYPEALYEVRPGRSIRGLYERPSVMCRGWLCLQFLIGVLCPSAIANSSRIAAISQY
jgi:hypothetical protein